MVKYSFYYKLNSLAYLTVPLIFLLVLFSFMAIKFSGGILNGGFIPYVVALTYPYWG